MPEQQLECCLLNSVLIKYYNLNNLWLFCFLLQSKAFLQTAASLAPHIYEPHFNLSILSEKVIDKNSSKHL